MEAAFEGGRVSSDGGLVLMRELTVRTGVFRRFAECFCDDRDECPRVLALSSGPESP